MCRFRLRVIVCLSAEYRWERGDHEFPVLLYPVLLNLPAATGILRGA